MMKKWMALWLTLAMLMSVFCVPAAAAEIPTNVLSGLWLEYDNYGKVMEKTDNTKMTDGKLITAQNGSNRNAGDDWRTGGWTLNEETSINKVVVRYATYNTATVAVEIVEKGGEIGAATNKKFEKTVGLDFRCPPDTNMNQVLSFDTQMPERIVLHNVYLTSANKDNGAKGKNAYVAEVEAYLVTPESVSIDAYGTYGVKGGSVIKPKYSVLDYFGDAIADSTYNGLTYSLTAGSEYATVDANTGAITVKEGFSGEQDITVRAACTTEGYTGLSAEKTVHLTDDTVASLGFEDLPDFVMTNQTQEGDATLYPEVVYYGHDGEALAASAIEDAQKPVWSLETPVNGVSVNETTGALTVAHDTDGASFTLVCSTADSKHSVKKEVKLNQKVDLLYQKPAWTVSGWGQGSLQKALDNNESTNWSIGNHSASASYIIINMLGTYDVNYMKLRFNNINNSVSMNVAVSDRLVYNGGSDVPEDKIPTADYTGIEKTGDLPALYPIVNKDLAAQGKSVWSARSAAATENVVYNQKYVLTGTDVIGYLDTPMKAVKYAEFSNKMLGPTVDWLDNTGATTTGLGTVDVWDFELYNTAPNYVEIALPEDTDVTTSAAVIQMTASVHNGVAAEDAASGSTGTWTATGGFAITEDGKLTAAAGTNFAFGKITYAYTSNNLDADASVYVYNDNGTLRFANNTDGIFVPTDAGDAEYAEGKLLVPEGMTVDQLTGSLVFNRANTSAVVGTADAQVVDTGAVTAAHIVYVMYNSAIVAKIPVEIVVKPRIVLEQNGNTYTATAANISDLETATLILAEYGADRTMKQVTFANKDGEKPLTVNLTVTEGNTVKAMLFDSFESMCPITPAK